MNSSVNANGQTTSVECCQSASMLSGPNGTLKRKQPLTTQSMCFVCVHSTIETTVQCVCVRQSYSNLQFRLCDCANINCLIRDETV